MARLTAVINPFWELQEGLVGMKTLSWMQTVSLLEIYYWRLTKREK